MDLFLLVQTLEVLAGRKEKRETIVTGVSSVEKKKTILHRTCVSADLQTQLESGCAPSCTEPPAEPEG